MIPSDINNTINDFLKVDLAQRENVETVILCGSYATGMATTHSDIDLCYIGDLSGFKRESVVYNGYEFQLMIAPWSWYQHVVSEYERIGTNIGTITVMLATGFCLIGDDEKWSALQIQAAASYHQGPPAPTSEVIRQIRVRITVLWEDFCDAETEHERKWLAAQTLQQCIEAIFILRKWWAVKPKHQIKELKMRDPAMANLLAGCIDSFGRNEELKMICEYVLKPVGGWMNQAWKKG